MHVSSFQPITVGSRFKKGLEAVFVFSVNDDPVFFYNFFLILLLPVTVTNYKFGRKKYLTIDHLYVKGIIFREKFEL